jgi:2-keto-4-pentenoate hydratase/2-oxohepta-3-ene-1,7-dioic acid hydratase in catechol pathway
VSTRLRARARDRHHVPADSLTPLRTLEHVGGPGRRDAADDPRRDARLPAEEARSPQAVPEGSFSLHTQEELAPRNLLDNSLGVFLKAPSSLTGDGGTVRLPYHDRRFDQEGELAVIIGKTASGVPRENALDIVAGYACLLDMTMRDGEDRSVRKSFDTFTPAGPWLITPAEVGDVAELELRTWVDDQLRQQARLADLIWDVPQLIAYVSSVMIAAPR